MPLPRLNHRGVMGNPIERYRAVQLKLASSEQNRVVLGDLVGAVTNPGRVQAVRKRPRSVSKTWSRILDYGHHKVQSLLVRRIIYGYIPSYRLCRVAEQEGRSVRHHNRYPVTRLRTKSRFKLPRAKKGTCKLLGRRLRPCRVKSMRWGSFLFLFELRTCGES